MKELAPNTPVIVGIGFEQETFEDPTQCAEPWRLMVRAVRRAAADAGSETPLAAHDVVTIFPPLAGGSVRGAAAQAP